MKIWLVAIGEPLPTDDGAARLLRVGIMYKQLIARGAKVVWWTSAFDHQRKRFRDAALQQGGVSSEGGRIRFVRGCGYQKNVSVRRFLDHYYLAKDFQRQAKSEEVPDVILVSYPAIELSLMAAQYAHNQGIPVVVDVRDLWPDALYELFPSCMRIALRYSLFFWERWSSKVFQQATAVVGLTDEYVQWGLTRGCRARGALDQVFPMGYQLEKRADADSHCHYEALKYWEALGLSKQDWIICFFGTLGHHFDVETVIAAADLMRKRDLKVKIVICGDGENKEKYAGLAEHTPNVIFPGWVDKFQIVALMSLSRVGLAPYLATKNFLLNLPNKPLEYLSAGLPVLSSIEGVLGRVLRENRCGWIYNAGDSASLCGVIEWLLANKDVLNVYSRNAKALFMEKYDGNKVYGDMCDYLESLVVLKGVSRC